MQGGDRLVGRGFSSGRILTLPLQIAVLLYSHIECIKDAFRGLSTFDIFGPLGDSARIDSAVMFALIFSHASMRIGLTTCWAYVDPWIMEMKANRRFKRLRASTNLQQYLASLHQKHKLSAMVAR